MTSLGGAPWPFWLGGLALMGVTVGFWVAARRQLGVSGMYARVIRRAQGERDLSVDASDPLTAMLLQATQAQFGDEALAQAAQAEQSVEETSTPAPWTAQLLFLVMLPVGGAVAAWLRGGLHLGTTLGPEFARIIGTGPRAWGMLLFGGVLTGFGTRMCGGCSSGHGLSGCGRLQWASLGATAAFFGCGIATAYLLEWVVR